MIRRLKALIGERHSLRLFYHWLKAFIAALYFGFPARHLTVIGVTGTDGKTTTVGMTSHILRKNGIRCGTLSTAFFQIDDQITWNETRKTSPSPFIIQRFLRALVRKRITHAVLEVSSHGLVQHRLFATWPKVAAITNTSLEHLDYHKSMNQYRRDKAKLFSLTNDVHVMNVDDESIRYVLPIQSQRKISYSRNSSAFASDQHLFLTNISDTPISCSAQLHVQSTSEIYDICLQIPGSFNLENAMCAIGICSALKVTIPHSIEALKSFTNVSGRMERIDEGQPFSVFVDFTVSPNAYTKTLNSVRAMIEPGKRLLVLSGSCGDRMKEKRAMVGKICSELADVVVVTFEETYKEDPESIIQDVWSGIYQNMCEAHRISDRREAIRFILSQAQPGDAVLICGMGSYPLMETQGGQIEWNEQEIVRDELRSLLSSHSHE